ncbi:metal ABC transporter substrate-binding protein [bacterium]|nr:metal ABC transporter substrate-binding protein [bacterium]MBU1984487.1 metal ABC transporter substrate-binding protein [bacterium]
MKRQFARWILGICSASLILVSLSDEARAEQSPAPIRVVTSTTIIADVMRNVGGEFTDVTSLLPAGANPHSFEPTPADVSRLINASVVFLNGLGLEQSFEPLIAGAGRQVRVVDLSKNLPARTLDHGEHDHHDHSTGLDPHVWLDPTLVIAWIEETVRVLSELDPRHADHYRANADSYQKELHELDTWIGEKVAQIPPANRKIVSDHDMFGYFCERYGFERVGAIIPGFSTLSEPSARELASLEDAIRKLKVKAVFVGNTVNPTLARRVSEDTHTKLITLYTGSLTDSTGTAPDYIAYMRYNVTAIVNALK